ncbi:DUF6825 family protein [Kamptonema formosum]|uniref:DUF6825 family protein n=1 Tax=Kamptonema formosum TaxID=331992 RepID=UPI00034D4AE7|nr:hypothetical protein [Oscillatoria sp. PCC 10802]
MSNSLVHAFFVGRALAEALNEQLEKTLTDALSDLGKFDAEQRERLRQFTAQVLERACVEAQTATANRVPNSEPSGPDSPGRDLQATIDELRAEIAQLRVQLASYRSRSV